MSAGQKQAPYVPILHNVAVALANRHFPYDSMRWLALLLGLFARWLSSRAPPGRRPRPERGAGPGQRNARRPGSAVRPMAEGSGRRGARRADFRDELVRETLAGLEPLPRVIERSLAGRAQPGFNRYFSNARHGPGAAGTRAVERARRAPADASRASTTCSVASSSRSGAWRAATAGSSAATPVFQALATLAWEPRRAAYFRGELFDALAMVIARLHRCAVDDRFVGRRHGPDAVHAVELSEIRGGLRRRRAARHLDATPTTRSPRSRTISKASAGTTTRRGAAR